MHTTLLTTFTLASLSFLASAQTIDPNSVPLSLRDNWCTSQISACPLICTQETDGSAATDANSCDPATLAYSCICSNGLSPNISEYSQTVPFYECQQSQTNCRNNCGNDAACAQACVVNEPCGAQNPTRINATGTTTSGTAGATASGSAASTAVYSGFGASATTGSAQSASSSSSSKSAAVRSMVINYGQIYGLGVVAAGVVGSFAILL